MYVCHNYVHVHGHTLVSCTHAHWLVNINITQSESGKLNTYTCMRSWIIIKARKFENKYRSLTRTALQNDVPDTISFGTHIKNVCRHKVKINLLQTAIIHSYQRIKYKQIFIFRICHSLDGQCTWHVHASTWRMIEKQAAWERHILNIAFGTYLWLIYCIAKETWDNG